jgi:hypothetical protein
MEISERMPITEGCYQAMEYMMIQHNGDLENAADI